MAYTFQDFQKEVAASGLGNAFSAADMALARDYPDVGKQILQNKIAYNNATSAAERESINARTNSLRGVYGSYSGGRTGMEGDYVSTLSPNSYPSSFNDEILSRLDGLANYGQFSYDAPKPSYQNDYANLQQELLDAILNRPDFTWSKEEDPSWAAYAKQYRREGERASSLALAQAAALTGGIPSTAAVTAASQAGDYYASKLADKIPELYNAAYNRYLNEYQMMQSDLSAVNTQEQLAYQQYLDDLAQYNTDRDFAYEDYLQRYNMQANALAAYQDMDKTEYDRFLDDLEYRQNQNLIDWEQRYNLANLGAQYGDFSGLKDLGISPNLTLLNSGSVGGGGSGRSVEGLSYTAGEVYAALAAYENGKADARDYEILIAEGIINANPYANASETAEAPSSPQVNLEVMNTLNGPFSQLKGTTANSVIRSLTDTGKKTLSREYQRMYEDGEISEAQLEAYLNALGWY